MKVLYDGSFEGFLTLVYEVYHDKLHPSSIIRTEPKELLFEPMHSVFTDTLKAQKVLIGLKNKFLPEYYKRIFHIFLCDSISFETELLEFITLGFKHQALLNNITIPALFKLQALENELFRLVHKMYGFIRFEELEDKTLYAKIETKYNVLPFLGEHFTLRLGNHPFIIHDLNRSLAYVKNETSSSIQTIASFETPLLSSDETTFKALWKTFFTHVSIENRKNKKLQQQLVPLLYRTYMSEFQQ